MSGFRSRALKLTESTRLDVLIDNKMLLKKGVIAQTEQNAVIVTLELC
jgi:hypothetical protein